MSLQLIFLMNEETNSNKQINGVAVKRTNKQINKLTVVKNWQINQLHMINWQLATISETLWKSEKFLNYSVFVSTDIPIIITTVGHYVVTITWQPNKLWKVMKVWHEKPFSSWLSNIHTVILILFFVAILFTLNNI